MKKILGLFLIFLSMQTHADDDKVLNIYAWAGEIPDFIIRQFERETKIKINFSTYDNNEIMYAKIRSMRKSRYDLIIPSSYFVDRMRKQNMLEPIDKTRIPNLKNLDPQFTHLSYDPESQFSIPYVWGVTGIFYNANDTKTVKPKKWRDLWNPQYQNQLILLDDTREIFSMALLALGYPANDADKNHITAAFNQLKTLMPNVKVFSSDMVVSLMIDEDAKMGMAWNGDVYKAQQENNQLRFVFPEDGFVIWVDNLSIVKGAPHLDNAYQFLNFIMRPDVGVAVALSTRYPIANLKARKLLPDSVQNNPIIYPDKKTLKRGVFQQDLNEDTLNLYEKYWEQLKMGG